MQVLPAEENPPSHVTLIVLAALVLAGVAAYGGTLRNGFVFDDHDLIERNRQLSGAENPASILVSKLFPQRSHPIEFYRPVTMLTLALNHSLGGLDPAGYHFVNLLLHLANGILVFLVVRRLLGVPLAAASALVFETHPAASEAVAWVSGRADLLALFFCLLAVLSAVSRNGQTRLPRSLLLCAAGACALLAALSKEHALVLTGFLVAADVVRARPQPGRSGQAFLQVLSRGGRDLYPLVLGMGVLSIVLRRLAIGQGLGGSQEAVSGISLGGRFIHSCVILKSYILLYIWPSALSVDNALNFHLPAASFSDPAFLLSLSLVVSALVLGAVAAAMSRAARFGLLWAAAGYAMVSRFPVVTSNLLFAERYLYLPSVGLAVVAASAALGVVSLAAARAGARPGTRTVVSVMVVLAVASACVFRTRARVVEWKDDRTLFSAALAVAPDDPRALIEMGQQAFHRRDFREAEKLFSLAAREQPDHPTPMMSIAQAFRLEGREEEAERALLALAERFPQSSAVHFQLGQLYSDPVARPRDDAKAERAYRKALELAPGSGLARSALAEVLARLGRAEEATAEARRALEPDPADIATRLAAAKALLGAGKRDEAVSVLRQTSPLSVDSAYVWNTLADAFHRAGLEDEALGALERADALAPELAMTHLNRAIVLRNRGDFPGVERELRAALERAPDDARTHLRLAQLLIREKRKDEALVECDRAIAADASSAEARLTRADILLAGSRFSEAERDLRQAVALDPRSARGHYNLGVLCSRRGEREAALEHLREAVRLDPDNGEYARSLKALQEFH